MRQYEPIWIDLKRKHKVSITANRKFHARIIKAVGKEKGKDLGYKIEIEPRVSIMRTATQGSVLHFFLETKLPETELWKGL